MSNCPRCGAANKPGRSSCWNCLSVLPPNRPDPAELIAVHRNTPIADAADDCTTAGRETAPHPASKQFRYIADPAVEAGEGGARNVMWVVIAVTVFLLAGVLYWYLGLNTAPKITSAAQVAREYLSALATYDLSSQQQLASEESKGVTLPPWLTMVSGRVIGSVVSNGERSEAPVEIHLAPAVTAQDAETNLPKGVFAQTYRLSLSLIPSSGGWRVDQRALMQQLRQAMMQKNPEVVLPAWE